MGYVLNSENSETSLAGGQKKDLGHVIEVLSTEASQALCIRSTTLGSCLRSLSFPCFDAGSIVRGGSGNERFRFAGILLSLAG